MVARYHRVHGGDFNWRGSLRRDATSCYRRDMITNPEYQGRDVRYNMNLGPHSIFEYSSPVDFDSELVDVDRVVDDVPFNSTSSGHLGLEID